MPNAAPAPPVSHAKSYAALALGVFAIGWSALFVRWSNRSSSGPSILRSP